MGGTTKKLSSGVFELNHWAPGDRMRIQVNGSNLSNVKTKIRLKVVMQGDLAGALTLKVYRNGFDQDPSLAAIGKRTLVTEWADVEAGVNPGNFGVDVHFVNHGTEITSNAEGIDNQYQDRSANIIITYEAVQGNANVEDSLLEKANTILATNAALGEPNKTMYDALTDLDTATAGMKAQMLEAGYLWGADEDLFYEAADVPTGMEYRYFKPSATLDATYSTYAYNWFGVDTVNLVGKGFDMGDVESTTIGTINYTGVANTPRTNIIRGNTNVNINIDAPLDTVYHYGEALHVVITAVANQSYHEFGNTKFIEIASGRVALEKEAEVSQLHFVYDDTNKKFNDIIVAYEPTVTLPKFSRDKVALADIQSAPKLVVELQNSVVKEEAESDYIWLYQEGLKEQMRVTDVANPTPEELAAAPKSTDESVANKTSSTAEQIANNIAGNDSYADLVSNGEVNENGSIKEEVVSTIVKDSGLTEQEKATAVKKYVQQDCDHEGYTFTPYNNYWRIENEKYEFYEVRVCDECGQKYTHHHSVHDDMYCSTCEHMIPLVIDTFNIGQSGLNQEEIADLLNHDCTGLTLNENFTLGFDGEPANLYNLPYVACFNDGTTLNLLKDYEHAQNFANYNVDFTLEFNIDIDINALNLAGSYSGMYFSIQPSFSDEYRVIDKHTEIPVIGTVAGGYSPITYSYLGGVNFMCGLDINPDKMSSNYSAYFEEKLDEATVTLRLEMYEGQDRDNRLIVNTMTIPLNIILGTN